MEAYTPATDSWAPVPDLPTARTGLGAATGADGRIFTFGGVTETGGGIQPGQNGCAGCEVVEAYDPRANTWGCSAGDSSAGCASTTLARLPTPRSGLAVVRDAASGRIYLFAGGSVQMEAYDPRANTWSCSTGLSGTTGCASSTLAPMPAMHANAGAAIGVVTRGGDESLFAIGGQANAGDPGAPSQCDPENVCTLASVDAYDLKTNTWSAVVPMNDVRVAPAAIQGPDGHIYVLGGADTAFTEHNQVATVERYDP